MIGFEAEVDVPIFQDIAGMEGVVFDGEQDVKAIYSFLFGGHEKTDATILKNDEFTIKPDVSDYPGQQLFEALAAIDPTFAAHTPRRAGKPMPVLIRKMEYITPPINEMDAAADQIYERQAASIKGHLAQFGPQAAQKVFHLPETNCYVGIPVQEIQQLIRKTQNPAQVAEANNALTNIQLKVQQRFALQATAGIFPSIIPELFRRRLLDEPSPKLKQAWDIAFPMIATLVQKVFDDEEIKKEAWMQRLTGNDVHLQAFKGHLCLLSSYVIGDALSESTLFENMSAKNAVPYHAKINLGYIHKALPEGFVKVAPAPPPEADEEHLVPKIAAVLTEDNETRKDIWLERKFGLKKRPIKPKERREHLVIDAHLDFVINALFDRQVQTLINQSIGRNPNEKAHELVDPDAVPPGKDGEKGVQLEFRRLGMDEVAPGELAGKFMAVVTTVRELNKPRMA